MSSLARSLLALAAMLVISTAQPPATSPTPPNCAAIEEGDLGQRDIVQRSVTVKCPKSKIPDVDIYQCPEYFNMRTCGARYEACNPDPIGSPPIISNGFVICTDPFETEAIVHRTAHCTQYWSNSAA